MAVLPERLNAACLTMTATGLKKTAIAVCLSTGLIGQHKPAQSDDTAGFS